MIHGDMAHPKIKPPSRSKKQKAGRAQDEAQESQIKRPEQGAQINLFEHLMCKQLQSETAKEQPADDDDRP